MQSVQIVIQPLVGFVLIAMVLLAGIGFAQNGPKGSKDWLAWGGKKSWQGIRWFLRLLLGWGERSCRWAQTKLR